MKRWIYTSLQVAVILSVSCRVPAQRTGLGGRPILSRKQQRQSQQQQQHRGPAGRYPYVSPQLFSGGVIERRLIDLENKILQMPGLITNAANNLRVTVSQTLQNRLAGIRQEFSAHDMRLSSTEEEVQNIKQEMKYLKNSNAHMQKRLDRLEKTKAQQDERIQNLQDSFNQLQPGESPRPSAHFTGNVLAGPVNRSEFLSLSEKVRRVKLSMNDTRTAMAGYDSHFESFAENLNMLSKKTTSLQLESTIVGETLREINENLHNVQTRVDNLGEGDSPIAGFTYDSTLMDDLQSTVEELSDTVRSVESTQYNHSAAIRNLTDRVQGLSSATSASSSLLGSNSDYDTQISSSQLVTSIVSLENSLRRTNENQRTSSDRCRLRLAEVTADVATQQAEISRVEARLDGLDIAATSKFHERLISLNNSLLRHDQILLDIASAGTDAAVLPLPSHGAQANGTFNGDADLNHHADDDLNGPEKVDRIHQIEEYLTVTIERKISSMEQEFLSFQYSLNNLGLRLDGISQQLQRGTNRDLPGAAPFISSRASLRSGNDRLPSPLTIQKILDDLDALNSSVAVQSTMLSEGFQQLGDYDRRLREKEKFGGVKNGELEEIRRLLQNATTSLSRMSLTIAEHDITIPSIFETLNMGNNIIEDLNNEVYKHDEALRSLNRSLQRMEQEMTSTKQAPSPGVHLAFSQQPDPKTYVTRAEFDLLTDALADIAAQNRNASGRETSSDLVNATSINSRSIKRIWKEVTQIQGSLRNQGDEVALASRSAAQLQRNIDDAVASAAAWRRNMTTAYALLKSKPKHGKASRSFESLLKRLRVMVIENRRVLSNHRRRLKLFAFLKRHCARHSQVNALNQTISAELHLLHHVMEEVASNVTSFSEMLPFVEGDKNLTILDGETDFVTIADIVSQIGNLSAKIDNIQQRPPPLPLPLPKTSHKSAISDDLSSLPTAVRLLETQIQSFQEVMSTLPKLDNKIEALKAIRNLVFQNSQGISSFHNIVTNMEKAAIVLRRNVTSLENKGVRLEAYHDNLRTQLNDTKYKLRRTDDNLYEVSRSVERLARTFRGNLTEINDRGRYLAERVDSNGNLLGDLTTQFRAMKSTVTQQSLTMKIQHADAENRLTRLQTRFNGVNALGFRHEERLDKINRTLGEEATLRARTGGEQEVMLLDLRKSVSSLDDKNAENRLKNREQDRLVAQLRSGLQAAQDAATTDRGLLNSLQAEQRQTQSALQNTQKELRLSNEQVNNFGDGLTETRAALNEQRTRNLQTKQTIISIRDDVSNLRRNVQAHEAFVKRAENILTKHRSDISLIVEHASNHSVAIERLKQRTGYDPTVSFSNLTRDIVDEMRLLDESVLSVKRDIGLLKRDSSVQDANILGLESRIDDLSNSALEYQNKVRNNKELGERLRNDLRKESNSIRDVKSTLEDQQTATSDLEQVVISNRNELVQLRNLRSSLQRLQSDSTRHGSAQENRTRDLRKLYEAASRKLSAMTNMVNNHERTLVTMRQDRISLDADIDQMYQSASGLEEVLRKTVTDSRNLRQDFEVATKRLTSLEKLGVRIKDLKAREREASSSIASHENKLSHLQSLTNSIENSLAQLRSSISQRERSDHSRDQSRAHEIRDIRHHLDRVPFLLRKLRAELSRHNDRINSLSGKVVSAERRVDRTGPKSRVSSDNFDDSLSHSGYIPSTAGQQNDFATSLIPSKEEHSKEGRQSVSDLSEKVAKLIFQFDLLLYDVNSNRETLNESMGRIDYLSESNLYVSTSLSDLNYNLSRLATSVSRFEDKDLDKVEKAMFKMQETFEHLQREANSTFLGLVSGLTQRIESVEDDVKTGLKTQGSLSIKLNSTLVKFMSVASKLRQDNATNAMTRETVDSLQDTLTQLDGDVTVYASRLENIANLVEAIDSNVSEVSGRDRFHAESTERVIDLLRAEIAEDSTGFSRDLQTLNDKYRNASETVARLRQLIRSLENATTSTRTHSHDLLSTQIDVLAGSVGDIADQITHLQEQIQVLTRKTENQNGNIESLDNKHNTTLFRVTQLEKRTANLLLQLSSTSNLDIMLVDMRAEMESLKSSLEARETPSSLVKHAVPYSVIKSLDRLIEVLRAKESVAQSLVTTTKAENETGVLYTREKEEEPAYRQDYLVFDEDELDRMIGPGNEELFKTLLQNTNRNVGEVLVGLITTLQDIRASLASEPPTTIKSGLLQNASNSVRWNVSYQDVFNNITRRLDQLEVGQNRLAETKSRTASEAFSPDVPANFSYSSLAQNVSRLQSVATQWSRHNEDLLSLTSLIRRKQDSIRDDVTRHEAIVFNLLSDVAHFNRTLRSFEESLDLLDLGLSNVLLSQDRLNADAEQWRLIIPAMRTSIESSESLAKKYTDSQNNVIKQRLSNDVSDIRTVILNLQSLVDDQLKDISSDVESLNESVRLTATKADEIAQNANPGQSVDFQRSVETRFASINQRENDVAERQGNVEATLQDISISSQDLDRRMISLAERLAALQNYSYGAYKDLSRNILVRAQQASAESREIVDELDNKLAPVLITLTSDSVDMRRSLDALNWTMQEDRRKVEQVETEAESAALVRTNNQLAVMRHAKELQGFSRTFTAVEDLIRTLSETIDLNSNQVTLLTDNGNQQTATLNLVTGMLANHSVELQKLAVDVAFVKKNQNRASIRVVIPPQVKRVLPTATTTSPATTTTTTTKAGTPAAIPVPTGLNILSVEGTKVVMSWNPVNDSTISGYQVVFQNRRSHKSHQFITAQPILTALNLEPNSKYLIAVYSSRNGQLSRPLYGTTKTFRRLAPRPLPRPSTVTIAPTTTTTAPATHSNAAVTTTTAAQRIAETAVFHCDFESDDVCNFLDDDTDDFDWIRSNGSTPSSDTGPSGDHTVGTDEGFYMFIEASRPRLPGHSARLLSPLLEPTTGQCLEFFYHMFGVGTGDLKVHIRPADSAARTQLWSESGDHENQWKRGRTSVVSDQPFRLVFEAIRGTDYHGDIAFDDVILRPGACPSPRLQCGFEQADICGFTQDLDDDFDWSQNSGATSSADTGPITDHTLGNAVGKYLYLEASNPRHPGDTTRISSPTMEPTNAQCLQFYYHMHGVDIASLRVYIRHSSTPNDLGVAVWSRTGPQGNDWILGRTTIVSPDYFQIVFEGTRGNDYHGDIAIDDVSITDGKCDQPVCSVGVKFGDLCYKVQEEGLNYRDASDNCRANGGLLATVKTQKQQDFLADLVGSYGNQWTLFWIGLDDQGVEGRFVYSDGHPLPMSAQSFGAWAPGEPNDALGDEDCVTMEYQSKDRLWNDVPCNREQWFICQFPVSL